MIVVAGDIHLKRYVYNSHRELEGDSVEGFKQVVNFANENNAEAIILAGDVWDPLTSWSLMQYNNILSGYDGEVYGIDGNPNHDKSNPPWMTIDDVKGEYIHKRKVEIGGMSFYGMRNMPRSKAEKEFKEVPKCDFLICHQLVPDISWAPGSWNMNPEWLPKHVSNVISGDCHDPSVVFDLPSGNRGYYTGTLVPQNRGEIGYDTGFTVITDEGEIRRSDVTARTVDRIKVTSREDVDTAIEDMKDYEDAPLGKALFVDYPIDKPEVLEHINTMKEEQDEQDFHIIPYPYSGEGSEDDVVEISTSSSDMMMEAVEHFTDNKEVRELSSRLLEDCSKKTLTKFRNEFDPNNTMGLETNE